MELKQSPERFTVSIEFQRQHDDESAVANHRDENDDENDQRDRANVLAEIQHARAEITFRLLFDFVRRFDNVAVEQKLVVL